MSNNIITPMQKSEEYYVSSGTTRSLDDATPLGVFHGFNSNTSSKRTLFSLNMDFICKFALENDNIKRFSNTFSIVLQSY